MTDAIDKVLAIVEELRDESRVRDTAISKRLDTIDGRLANQEHTDTIIIQDVRAQGARLGSLERRMGKLEDEQHQSKRVSIEGDEAQSAALVSAMTIHDRKLEGVKADVAEVKADVGSMKDNTGAMAGAMADIAITLQAAIRNRVLRAVIVVAAVLGATVGGGVAGYVIARGEHGAAAHVEGGGQR
jgi:hypothetical protein